MGGYEGGESGGGEGGDWGVLVVVEGTWGDGEGGVDLRPQVLARVKMEVEGVVEVEVGGWDVVIWWVVGGEVLGRDEVIGW